MKEGAIWLSMGKDYQSSYAQAGDYTEIEDFIHRQYIAENVRKNDCYTLNKMAWLGMAKTIKVKTAV